MNSLSNLCVVASSSNPSAFSTPAYKDAEIRYIKSFYQKLQMKKDRYFFNLCKYYLIFHFIPDDYQHDDQLYQYIDLEKLTHWQRAMWAACEVCFGDFHSAQDCVDRIRLELPFEHQRGNCLKFTMERFEKSLTKNCPNMKGNVHDWYKVFLNAPPKILLYEEFFG